MKIDVVIPYFNKEKHINRALSSIDFDYVNKVFVIDDCSNNVIDLSEWSNVHYIRNKTNNGPSYSRNKGVELSNADFVMFLDADDYYDKKIFPILNSQIEVQGVEVISWKIKQVKNEDISIGTDEKLGVEVKDTYFYHREKSKGNLVMTASSFCISRELYVNSGGFNKLIRLQEDPEFFCRVSAENKITFLTATYSYYDISDSNSLSQSNLSSVNMPMYVKNLADDSSIYAKELYQVEFKKFFLLSLMNKSNKNYKEFLIDKYQINLPKSYRALFYTLSLVPSFIYRFAYKLFREIKFVS